MRFLPNQLDILIRKASKEAYSKKSSSPTIAEAFLGKAFTRFRLLRSKTYKRFNVKKARIGMIRAMTAAIFEFALGISCNG
jgi:hypothetical protein